jgi:hypothetical protein
MTGSLRTRKRQLNGAAFFYSADQEERALRVYYLAIQNSPYAYRNME